MRSMIVTLMIAAHLPCTSILCVGQYAHAVTVIHFLLAGVNPPLLVDLQDSSLVDHLPEVVTHVSYDLMHPHRMIGGRSPPTNFLCVNLIAGVVRRL